VSPGENKQGFVKFLVSNNLTDVLPIIFHSEMEALI
jgi:hypothetical protein